MPPAKKQKKSPAGTPISKKVEADRPTPPKGVEATKVACASDDGVIDAGKTGKLGKKGASDNNIGKDGADRKVKARKLGKMEEDGGDKASGKTAQWGILQEGTRNCWRVRTGLTSKSFSYKTDGNADEARKAAEDYYATCTKV